MTESQENGQKYVYGVVSAEAPPPVHGEGIAGGSVETIAHEGVAALTSDVPAGELEAGREELTTHARVLEEALGAGVVLPMRFGMVMPDADTVREELLAANHDALEAQLYEFEGKVELNVRATYDEEALLREVVQGDPEIAALSESLRGQSEDATYYERLRLGEMVAEAVTARREGDSQALVDRLEPLALATEVAEPVHERMALNASFLVERGRVEEFEQVLESIGGEQAGRIRFKLTGPLPPHSFVELSLES